MLTVPINIELESIQAQDVLVSQLELARKKLKQPKIDFNGRLTNITIADTMKGSSTLTVELLDPDHSVLDSGFFDCRDDGKLDAIEINYPVGTGNWWRLTSVDFSADHRISMTLMERVAVQMQHLKGPLKTSRAKKTRAQFLQMLFSKVGKEITFQCKELTKKQKKQREPKEKVSDEDRKATKSSGIPRDADITFDNWDGSSYTLKSGEIKNAEAVCDAISACNAPEKAQLACLAACIVEGPFFRNPASGDASSVGVLQLLASWGSLEKRRDIGWVVEKFLKEGFYGKRDPSAKGAIDLANKHRDWTVGEIAQETQGSAFPDRYEKVKAGAQKVWEAYGGASGSGGSYTTQYNFQVGGRDNPRESYWDAAQRLADEVRWALFIDGSNVYYDSEMTLIGQKAAAVIRRQDPAVVDWRITWDERHIATEMSLTLVCEPFQFRAGEVFQLVGFGPASTGSKADPKRPGYWLVSEMNRDIGSLATEFTLTQPQAPKAEPRGERAETAGQEETKGSLMEAMKKISRNTPGYTYGGNHGPKLKDMKPSDHFDCSSSSSYALWLADMFPGDVAITSGVFASSWGEAGRGQTFTVWANGGHVFIQGEGSDGKWRFDTGGPGGGSGAKFRTEKRPTAGFTPRHWKGN